ncbi:hypothetical protein AVEN_51719-1 [Araneus ventricosus]|uniref:MADF domain-containing protein n=1 Tax=Araneus ventricosus TaxID=182803 RepID=A0A4Y2GHS4_ARAVE|nr:hypothetical protein AVEN_51719-1 [Araneus ventricosus]
MGRFEAGMAEEIDNEFLISLVQVRPVLCDKTLQIFKDRIATQNAWRDICCELKNDFETMEKNEKNLFGKAVMKRWVNLRNSISRYRKKLKECKKSGSGSVSLKKYIYNDQLHFSAHIYNLRETDDSLECAGNREEVLFDNELLQLNNVTTEEKKLRDSQTEKGENPMKSN